VRITRFVQPCLRGQFEISGISFREDMPVELWTELGEVEAKALGSAAKGKNVEDALLRLFHILVGRYLDYLDGVDEEGKMIGRYL